MTNRIKQIRLASWVGIITNSALAIFIIWSGVIAGSFSLVANGVDSSGDVLISVLTLFISYLLSRPPNVKFPYGYGKAEPNATVLLSFVIFFAGAQLVIASVTRLGEDNVPAMPDKLAIYAIVTSVVAKVCLALFQKYMGKKTQSSMLLAYARNMQGDVVISFSVFVGLILTNLLDLPVLDIIIALAVGIWVMWVAVKIFIETNMELMDGNIEQGIYQKVFDLVEAEPGVKNPHRMRIRKVGNRLMINIDVEMNGDLSLRNAHELAHILEKKVRDGLKYEVFDVIIHTEPYGDEIKESELGVSREVLKKNEVD